MNTNYDDEATRYPGDDNEATQYEDMSTVEYRDQDTSSDNKGNQSKDKKNGWKRVAAGAGAGLLIGGVATIAMGMNSSNSDTSAGKEESGNNKDELSHPEWVDDQIQVATSVNDDMSFDEAFAAARHEVGPGGCFEWHGNLYGTYLADEWNNMTAEQRAEYGSHFSWNHIDHSSSNVAQHSTSAHSDHDNPEDSNTPNSDDDIQVVSVNHANNSTDVANQESGMTDSTDIAAVEVSASEPEIEVLGVVHDNETGANIGGLKVDGQEVILIDVNDDQVFDYTASDVNNDGQMDQNEIADIQEHGLTVNDLGGFSNPFDNTLASTDNQDYSSDIYEG